MGDTSTRETRREDATDRLQANCAAQMPLDGFAAFATTYSSASSAVYEWLETTIVLQTIACHIKTMFNDWRGLWCRLSAKDDW